MKTENNEQKSSSINDQIISYENVFETEVFFANRITFKNRSIFYDGKSLNWKNEKALFRSIVAKNLDIKKTEIDYDILFVALLHVAKQHREEDDNTQLISEKYLTEHLEIEELLDEIENDDTLEHKTDWQLYREWKNEEAIKIYNADGEVTGIDTCYDNIVGWLEHFPLLKNKIRYNDKSYRIDIWGEIYDDNTVHTIMSMLNKYFIRKYSSIKGLNEAIKGCANKHHYHPFKEYLESLTYNDNQDWFEYILKEVLHVEMWEEYGDLYLTEFRKWMYACVKRIYEPGTKFDNILVLVSKNQGTGKSSIWERLFTLGKESYCKIVDASQNIPEGDRFIQQCAAKVCINFDEIAMKAKNVNKIKTMLSQQNDEWHTLYSVADAPKNRDFLFVGTTNNTDFLKDYTSMFERRWWLIKITEDTNNGVLINAAFDNVDLNLKDNVWAQAKHMYDNKLEKDLYITQGSELGQKLEILQRGYKASNNEDYAEIVNIMQMDWGFFDEDKFVNIDSLVKQYKYGDPIEYCKKRNNEIYNLTKKDGYVIKPEDKYYTCFGQIDRWPTTLLYELLNKLGIQYTKQSLTNELEYSNEFNRQYARCPMTQKKSTWAWCRNEDTPTYKINNIENNTHESERSNELPF